MLIYWPMIILNILVSIICYITNPIVCLFSNEEGELPGVLNFWQTYDDSLNPSFFVKTRVPSFLRYDYDRHYEEYEGTTPDLEAIGKTRWFCKVIDPNFTIKERIQRYFCQVLWLTRNNAYGFSLWFFGRNVDPDNVERVKDEKGLFYAYDRTMNWATRTWCYKNDTQFTKHIRWCVYLGWKINKTGYYPEQSMIANRIAIRFKTAEDQ